MFKIVRITALAITGLLAVGGFTYKALADEQTDITVTVDNQVINFPGTQPVETNGSVLVPLRGVFEALHAHVDYDSADNTVTATHGQRTVVVPIGSTNATIDGQSQQLSQPAEVVNGSTLVPLRFVAEAFGDYVGWNGDTHTVIIQRQHNISDSDSQQQMTPASMTSSDSDVVIGKLRRVLAFQDPAKIVVGVYGHDETIDVSHDVNIERGLEHHEASTASLSDLKPDDRLVIHENAHGRAVSIRAVYGS